MVINCFKNITSVHERLSEQLSKFWKEAIISEWMMKEKTNLILKDSLEGIISGTYGPIMCLPMKSKILTAQIKEEIYYLLECCGLFPEEWKGYCKGKRWTDDQLYVNQRIFKEVKTRWKNVDMAWIDHKNVYDLVSLTWKI